jgi:hypothetical protein
MGGVFFFFWGSELNKEKITEIKSDEGLRWLPFDILHATTNQKHAGMTEGDGIGCTTMQERLGSAMATTRAKKMTTTSTARRATFLTSRSIFFTQQPTKNTRA